MENVFLYNLAYVLFLSQKLCENYRHLFKKQKVEQLVLFFCFLFLTKLSYTMF